MKFRAIIPTVLFLFAPAFLASQEATVGVPIATGVNTIFGGYALYHLSTLNTEDLEYAPTVTAEGRRLYFASDRSGGAGKHDVWTTVKSDPRGTEFDVPTPLSDPINSEGNEGIASIRADGRYLVFSACNRDDGFGDCDLYIAAIENGEWKDVMNFAVANSPFWDTHPSISGSGDTLFFCSNRPKSVRPSHSQSRTARDDDSDIFMTIRGSGGTWGQPVRLPSPINSSKKEEAPFILPGSHRLYFASDDNDGEGGFDLYFADPLPDGGWSEPRNLGAPFNSSDDDRFVSALPNEGLFYFTSDRSNPNGTTSLDLYMVVFAGDASRPSPWERTLGVTPNPAGGKVTIALPTGASTSLPDTLRLSDGYGDEIFATSVEQIPIRLSVSEIPPGLYFVRIGDFSAPLVIRR